MLSVRRCCARGNGPMRWIVDGLMALMVTGILAAVVWYHHGRQEAAKRNAAVQEALSQLHELLITHAAIDPDLLEQGVYPKEVPPEWFTESEPPRNVLAGESHPWLDIAPEGDLSAHPPDPVLDSPNQAGFWYNPNRGIFRARVPRQFTEQETLSLYNRLNDCSLPVLPDGVDDLTRRTTGVIALSRSLGKYELESPLPNQPKEESVTPRRSLLDPVRAE